MPDPTTTSPATTVRILDARGNPVTRVIKDQQIRIEVTSPTAVDAASPPGRLEVNLAKEGGWRSDDLTIGWDGNRTAAGTTHVSRPLTIASGGKGAAEWSIEPLGLSWSRGDFSGLGTDDGQVVTVTGPDGSVAAVQVFTSGVTKAHADLVDAANVRAASARTAAAVLTAALAHLDQVAGEPGVDAGKVAELRARLEQRLAWAKRDLCVAERARAHLANPAYATPQQNAAARYFLAGAAGADAGTIDESGLEETLRNASAAMWDGAILDSLTELAKSSYQGITRATGAAQVMTLFGTTELGKPAKWIDRATAALDLISMGALLGANMRYQLDHAIRSDTPPGKWGPGNRPRFDGDDPKTAPTGVHVDPLDLGYSPDGVRAALNTARNHDVIIQARPTVETAPQLKADGAIPKAEAWKAKTSSPVDQLLGADPDVVHGRVSLFEPKPDLFVTELRNAGVPDAAINRSVQAMRDAAAAGERIPIPERPPGSAVPEGLWELAAKRFGQRQAEWVGPTGKKMREAAAKGEIEIEPGGAVKEGGRYITGDYDLWDITDRNGAPLTPGRYATIVAELQANAFEAQHGAHRWWDPQRSSFKAGAEGDAEFATARGIYEKIIESHKPGGEILIAFGPEGPPVAVYSGQTPAPHLGGAPTSAGELVAGSRLVVPSELVWFAGNELVQQSIDYGIDSTELATLFGDVTREAIPCESCIDVLVGDAPTSWWKKPVVVGAAATAVAVGLIFGVLGGEDAEEPVRISLGEDPVLVDEPADEVEVFVPDATMVAFVGECSATVHNPLIGYPDSPSHALDTGIAVGVDGPLPDGLTIEATRAGADAPARAPVDERGVFVLPFPVSAYDTYGILTVRAIVGDTELAVTTQLADVVVGPDEGTNGCTPATELDDAAIRALVSDAGFDPDGGPAGPPAIEEDDPIPPPEDELAIVREFLGQMDRAHRAGDVDFLLDTLDPLTIGRYGRDQCESYLGGVVGSIAEIELLGGQRGPYDYPTDGVTVELFDAWAVQIEATVQGADRVPFDLHLRQTSDGVTWFSDCGTPVD